MDWSKLDEETLKIRIAEEYFGKNKYETLGKIDFAIYEEVKGEKYYHLWAEAKRGTAHKIEESFVQLILTIGKSPATQNIMPPYLLAAMDAEKIAFIEYSEFHEVFAQNDFNWNVAPSDHGTKEFRQLEGIVGETLRTKNYTFRFGKDDKELREFIKANITKEKIGINKVQIHKHNFIHVYYEWCEKVRNKIKGVDWEKLNKRGILSADFFLADLMCLKGKTMFEKLGVLWADERYQLKRPFKTEDGLIEEWVRFYEVDKEAHDGFWFKYERPPKEEYREFILERRDLLVPVDVRETKGSYFTPSRWVKLSQQYLSDALGEEWQEEYYVWDCCAGTGNLLKGLSGYARIFASTLDDKDVKVMRETIADKVLPEGNIFQFDFLNDDLGDEKVPERLREIIKNEPEKLVIYINPPYAEADARIGKGRSGVAASLMHTKYDKLMGYARREVFVQFFTRIYEEIKGCTLAEFSKLKILQAPALKNYRDYFRPKLKSLFLMPADTFDNVSGMFPIGFFIWNTNKEERFESIEADCFDRNCNELGRKAVVSYDARKLINDWTLDFIEDKKLVRGSKDNDSIGNIIGVANDFQNVNSVCIERPWKPWNHKYQWQISKNNIIQTSIYFSVRLCKSATWLNDRDQFLYPNDGWKDDVEFQSNCLAYTLFHGQNRISSEEGVNHWIPFEEKEVGAKTLYESHFMLDFMKGKVVGKKGEGKLFGDERVETGTPIVFGEKARAVMDAGRELWRYYHRQEGANANASYYDIKRYFQGYDEVRKKMNARSEDARYEELHDRLKGAMKVLGKEIEGKVWEYGFLL